MARRRFLHSILAIVSILLLAGSARASVLDRHVVVGGMDRHYVAYIPDAGGPRGPLPVVLAFHGALGDPAEFAELTNLQNAREAANFIVVFPEGYRRTWNAGAGCCGPAGQENVDDVGFVRVLLADLGAVTRIDRQRVYAAGYSNGGAMSFRLACELSDSIAAISTVGSVMREPQSQCRPARAVPVFEWHGLLDGVSPYNGGMTGARGAPPAPPVQDTVDFWARIDGTRSVSHEGLFGGRADCDIYSGGRDGARVEECRIPGMGHRWPGSHATWRSERGDRFAARFVGDLGPYAPDIDANDAILRFFREFTLPQ